VRLNGRRADREHGEQCQNDCEVRHCRSPSIAWCDRNSARCRVLEQAPLDPTPRVCPVGRQLRQCKLGTGAPVVFRFRATPRRNGLDPGRIGRIPEDRATRARSDATHDLKRDRAHCSGHVQCV
jgi:hypothetical protein